jgi:hypothetical protein
MLPDTNPVLDRSEHPAGGLISIQWAWASLVGPLVTRAVNDSAAPQASAAVR